jgi:DNA-binding NarL/FixJ family response regulator
MWGGRRRLGGDPRSRRNWMGPGGVAACTCFGMLAAGFVAVLSTRSDRPLVAATPVVVLVAVVFTPRLRALEIILVAVSLRLIMDAFALDLVDPGAGGLIVTGASAILGMSGARYRPWLARAAGDAASAIAHHLQAPAPAATNPVAVDPRAASAAEVARGENGVSRLAPAQLLTGSSVSAGRLSRRQQEVVSLVLLGLTAREIGRRLFISERTVETHLANVYERLDVHSRHQLILSQGGGGLHLVGGIGAGEVEPLSP